MEDEGIASNMYIHTGTADPVGMGGKLCLYTILDGRNYLRIMESQSTKMRMRLNIY